MEVVNNTKNTIYIEDVDLYLPYQPDAHYLSPEILKKSRCLRSYIINGMLSIEKYDDNETIEHSLMYLRQKAAVQMQDIMAKCDDSVLQEEETNNTASLDIEVKIRGLYYDASGYGKVNRNLAYHLSKYGIKVKIDPKKSQNNLNEQELSLIMPMESTVISRNHITIDSVIPSFAESCSGKYKILYTTIESHSVPKQFLDACTLYDEIWLTSTFSADILRPHVKQPIYVIVPGADTELYTETGPRFDFKPNIKEFVFVSVFGWNYRKGYDVLLKAYFDEFSRDDNVSLLIMSRYQGGTNHKSRNKIKEDIDKIITEFPNKDLPHVVRYSQIVPEKDMPKLYRACNAFVLFSRGEGINLVGMESSLCGLPVIMTNCTGQTEYVTKDNSYLIEPDDLAIAQTKQFNAHYWDGQKFPSLTSNKVHHDARSQLREVYENYTVAKEKNKKLQNFIKNNLTWKNSAEKAINRLKEIKSKLA